MNTKRLSERMENILNQQVTKEANASQTYLSYGVWADSEGYSGTANLLFRHSGEERNHMMKIIEYIQKRGGKTKVEALGEVPKDPKNLQDCFEKLFQHEVDNSEAIYKIVAEALEFKDWATWNFGQWFVKEQIEEETLIMELLDKLKIAGGNKATKDSLLYLDNKIGGREDDADLARNASVENPS